MTGVDYRGFVVAHVLKRAEDRLDYQAPSSVFI
jgi:hypothetical protein